MEGMAVDSSGSCSGGRLALKCHQFRIVVASLAAAGHGSIGLGSRASPSGRAIRVSSGDAPRRAMLLGAGGAQVHGGARLIRGELLVRSWPAPCRRR